MLVIFPKRLLSLCLDAGSTFLIKREFTMSYRPWVFFQATKVEGVDRLSRCGCDQNSLLMLIAFGKFLGAFKQPGLIE